MSQLRPQIVRYAQARVAANPQAHGLAGSAEYDAEVTARAVYAAEAGLSFFHTHAQGLGPLVIFASTVAASAVPWRRARGALYVLFSLGALFPLGLSRLLGRGARVGAGRRHRDWRSATSWRRSAARPSSGSSRSRCSMVAGRASRAGRVTGPGSRRLAPAARSPRSWPRSS